MAPSEPPAAAADEASDATAPPPWRSHIGRLRIAAAAVVVVALFGTWQMTRPFYEMHLDNVTVVDGAYRYHEGVSVNVSVSAFDLVNQPGDAPTAPSGAGMANTTTPATMLIGKLPATGTWFLLAAAALVAAIALQSILAAIGSVACCLLSVRALTALVRVVEDPAGGGNLVEQGSGLRGYQFALWTLTALSVPALVGLAKLRAARRAERRAAQAAAAAPAEPGLLDWLRGAVMTGAAVIGDNARRSAEARQGR